MNRGVTSFSISVAAPRPVAEPWVKAIEFGIPFPVVIGMVLLAAVLLCGSVIARSFKEFQTAKAQLQATETEVQKLQMENSQIRYEIQSMQDPAVIETIARRDLGLVRKGEMVLIRKASITVPAGITK